MQDLVGKAFGEVWGSSTMAPTYKIDAFHTWGLTGENCKGSREKGTKAQKKKKPNRPTTGIFSRNLAKTMGEEHAERLPTTEKHNPTHTPRLIIKSVLFENRDGKMRCTNTSQSKQTLCEV